MFQDASQAPVAQPVVAQPVKKSNTGKIVLFAVLGCVGLIACCAVAVVGLGLLGKGAITDFIKVDTVVQDFYTAVNKGDATAVKPLVSSDIYDLLVTSDPQTGKTLLEERKGTISNVSITNTSINNGVATVTATVKFTDSPSTNIKATVEKVNDVWVLTNLGTE